MLLGLPALSNPGASLTAAWAGNAAAATRAPNDRQPTSDVLSRFRARDDRRRPEAKQPSEARQEGA
jgi:hypothetical protein